jgi:ATP-dependent exoDNAse (exonuclease V) beta subunit
MSTSTGQLTPEQERAVARRGEPLLVSAGAGSGKTSVLVERFVRTVCEDGVSPARILAITFTDRAAGELRERVRARLLERAEREAARDTEAAFVSTFHGFCTRLLRSHALLVGLDARFQILDEPLAARLRERAFAVALAEFVEGERAEAVDLVAAHGADRLQSTLWRAYAQLRSRGQRRPRLPAMASGERALAPSPAECAPDGAGTGGRDEAEACASVDAEAAAACVSLDELLACCGRSYEALKRARGAVDFDDLELLALELLEGQESVRAAWSERFEAVMVDEFQDTNPRQLAILRALDRGSLFTVGDELQSIYGFRDADVRLFRARRAELAPREGSIELRRNFRSRAPLLAVVNAVFQSRQGDGYTPLIAARVESSANGAAPARQPAVELLLTSKRGWNGDGDADDGTAAARAGAEAPAWRQAEARALAKRVAEIVHDGEVRAGEVVVLLRALGDVDTYESALRDRGLRTLATAGGFWARQQVQDLLAYLRALANPLDELALYGTLASPLAGLSSDALALIARAAHARAMPVWATVQEDFEQLRARLGERDGELLAAFRGSFEDERRIAPARTISRLIERALQWSGYGAYVRTLAGAEMRMANVHKLLRLARRFEASEGRDLRAFLDHVAHQERLASAPEADAPVAGVEPDAVRLMSIHAAKGLEFDVVCVADLGRAANLSVPDLLIDGERIGLRLARLDGSEPVPALDFRELCEERRQAQLEEEDRILYVAMTRARERLLLSGAVAFDRWPEPRPGAPAISWLGPALAPGLAEIVRAHALEPGEPVLELAASPGASVRCRLNTPDLTSAESARPGTGERALSSAAEEQTAARTARSEAHARARAAPAPGGMERERGQMDSPVLAEGGSLSYTALSELRRCGYRFYLERVLGLDEDRAAARARPGREGFDPRARGTIVHRLLEAADFRRPSRPSVAQAQALARELGLHPARAELEEIARLAGAATEGARTLAPHTNPAARVAAAEHVRREHPFAFSLGAGEPLLTGVIDVLAREPGGGVLVLDYKTDRVGADEDLSALVEREYDLQRLLYGLAALRDGAPAVEIVHWFLERPEEPVSARYAAAVREALEARLAEHLQRARARGFAVSAQPHRGLCETCPGRSELCSWSAAETLRELPVRGALERSR